MVSTGPSDINGTSQPIPASIMRSSSGFLGTQNGANAMPSQSALPSLLSPRTQFNNTNMIGNVLNVASLPHQSFGNGETNVGPGNIQRLVNENGSESGPISSNGMAFNSRQLFGQSNMVNSGSSGQMHGQQFSNPLDQQPRNFQLTQQQLQQLSAPQNQNNFNTVKLEPQQIQQAMRSVKMEQPQQSDQSLLLQQRQQQMLQMSRSSSQAPINLLHQQRLLQFQQQQQQQQQHQLALKNLPLQKPPFPTQNLPLRPPQKPAYEPGMCARRLTRYTYEQQHRPEDNSIEFWRKFVAEFFAPNAKKKWCVSMYGSGRQTTGIFPQDIWQCEICNHKPGRGFEATAEVLPRLFKIKYESGTLEELLYIDMPREYQNPAGQIVLDYAKAIQESVFDQLRVVRDGQLRIVFSPELKICSWEFCARRHEELIPRRLLTPQVSQLGSAAQKYQASTLSQNASSNISADLQNNCNAFVASAKQVAKALEVPLVNDLGYSKRYVRCLQIAEVVNSMKDLIDYGQETATGPMESLLKFPRRTSTQSVDEQRPQNSNNDQTAQAPLTNGAPTSANHSLSSPPTTSSANAIANLIHQNSMNSSRSQYPTPTSSNNGPQNSPNISIQQQALSGGDDSQSSVQKIINQMITNTQSGVGNHVVNNGGRISMGSNTMGFGGGSLASGHGAINGYNKMQFDWKPSP